MISTGSEIQAIYEQLLDAWNNRNARRMAELFTEARLSVLMAVRPLDRMRYFPTSTPSLNTTPQLNM
jgi:hypothetical protein